MRSYISFYLGGSRAVIGARPSNTARGDWKGQTFIGVDAAAVTLMIITRHRASMSANVWSHD